MVEALRSQVQSLTQANAKLGDDIKFQQASLEEENKQTLAIVAAKQRQIENLMEESRAISDERAQKAAALTGETRLRAELEQQRDRLQQQFAKLSEEHKQV